MSSRCILIERLLSCFSDLLQKRHIVLNVQAPALARALRNEPSDGLISLILARNGPVNFREAFSVAFSASLPFVLGVSSCAPGPKYINNDLPLGPGWTCVTLPTSLSPPGTIYRVDPSGATFIVSPAPANLRTLPPSPFANPQISRNINISANVLASLLNIGDIKGSGDTEYSVSRNFSGMQTVATADDDITNMLASFTRSHTPTPNNTYYVVRQVVTATGLDYKFGSDINASFNADLKVKVGQVNPNAAYTTANGFSFTESFSSPVNVCSKSEAIQFQT
jgi:hypothetical protein